MQHIASEEALNNSTERLLTAATSLDDAGLGQLGSDLQAVSMLLGQQPGLRRMLSEATTPIQSRLQILARLLAGQIGRPAMSIVDFAIQQDWASGRDLRTGLGRLGRTAMFLRAERAGDLDDVEDELFRFGRIIDASPDLSVLLDDPTADPAARASLVQRLLGSKANSLTAELLMGLARDTQGRSFSHGVRELVDQAADRREKKVAVVTSALPLTDDQTTRLLAALKKIYGHDVTAHVIVDPALGGGMRIQVGDEVIDGSISGRLSELRRNLAS